MDAKPPLVAWQRPLVIVLYLLAFTLVGVVLYVAKEVLIPIALAVLLTFTLSPLVTRLDKLGLKRVVSVVVVVVLVGLVLTGLILYVGSELSTIVEDLPQHRKTIKDKVAHVRELGKGGVFDRLLAMFQEVAEEVKNEDPKGPPNVAPSPDEKAPIPVKVVQDDGPEQALRAAAAPLLALAPLLEPLAALGLALILVVFMLIHREDLRNRLVSFGRAGTLTNTTRALDDAGQRLSRFLLMQLFINGSFGLSVAVGLLILGVPYAPLWGLCAATFRYVPYIGPWVAALLPLSVSLVTSPGWTQMLLVLGLFLVLELISNNVMEPWLYGAGMGVSEVATLISAAFWGWLWGPIGLILSGPLTVCVVVMGRYVPGLAFLDRLLGDEPPLEVHATFLQRLLARDPHEASAIVAQYRREHSAEAVYDDVLIPALALARQERASGAMTADDEQLVLDGVRAVLVGLPEAAVAPPALPSGVGCVGCVVGAPAHHEVEELALVMFDQLIRPLGFPTRLVSTKTLPSEVLAEVKRDQPPAIFIAAVPPGGLVQAYYLCRRVRKRAPKALIVVGYLGYEKNLDRIITKMRAAGANYVTTTLRGARAHLQPLQKPAPPAAVTAAAPV